VSAEPSDEFDPRPVSRHERLHDGMVWDLVRDTVDLGAGGVVRREYVDHPGAVAVLALDDDDRVLLQRQYRHPVGMRLWEMPAGLLDVAGEAPLVAAQRELAEEADLLATRWWVLVDWFNSPGGSSEALRCYVARGLTPVPEHERHQRTAEELDMPQRWLPLAQARQAVLGGALHSPATVIGILAACAAQADGWIGLRPADAPWPEHPAWR